jgi:hypothetical protein
MRPSLALLSGACTIAGGGAAWCDIENGNSSSSPEAATSVETIVVTAERSNTTLQKTPLAITALTGQRLDVLGSTWMWIDDDLRLVQLPDQEKRWQTCGALEETGPDAGGPKLRRASIGA